MTFVPIAFVPPQPSPRAADLGERLGKVIQEFELQHQDLTGLELRQALAIATSRARCGAGAQRAVTLVAAAVVVGGLLAALLAQAKSATPPWILAALAIAVALVIAGYLVALRNR